MFDPYLEWFKIPADRRPPNYYELLEISPRDAADPDAIHNAAERRSDQLLRHTSGPHADQCVRIAEEIDTACKTLLDPGLRRDYEVSLNQPAAANPPATPNRKKPKPGPRPKSEAAQEVVNTPAVKRSPPWFLPLIGGVAVLLVLAGGTLAYFLNTPEKKSQKPATPIAAAAPVPTPVVAPEPAATAPEKKEGAPAATTTPTLTAPPLPTVPRLAPDPKEEKRPVPDAEAQEKATQELKETYKKDYEHLKTSDDRLALAAKFLQPGRENRKDAAAWYVLLTEARDLAVRAERPRLAVEAITEIDKHFTIDPLEMAITALSTISRPVPNERIALQNEGRLRTFVSVALGRVEPALKADNYDAALKFIALAEEVLVRFKADKAFGALITARRTEVLRYQNDFQAVATAQQRLKEAPDDPAANLAVGFHLACEAGKWDEGLPFIVRGSDPVLKTAAKADLDRPADSKSQIAIADFWWSYSRQNGVRSEPEVLLRAAYWYDKALTLFADGADRERAIDRIEDARRMRLAGGVRLAPGSVQGRDIENHTLLLREGGGTMASEEAVENGLVWLAAHQAFDGSWGTDSFSLAARCSCPDPGKKHDVAGTAFGLLPLLGAGNTYKQGKYRIAVAAGLTFLMKKQLTDGSFSTVPAFAPYENALATVALCEAYAMARDDYCLAPALKAVNYIVRTQSPFGGWGYEQRSMSPDTSVTLWQIWALKTAVNAGIYVPKETFDPMDNFLDRVVDRHGPGYWYKPPGPASKETGPRPSLLPDGILCRELLDWKQDTKGLARSARELAHIQFSGTKERPGIYYLFFSRQALHHFGGKEWEEWNPKTRDLLISLQDKGEEFAREHRRGSWSPVDEQWMDEGGRLMSTSMAILGLETYYSTVPLNGFGSAVLND
jgi:hypothetical protein